VICFRLEKGDLLERIESLIGLNGHGIGKEVRKLFEIEARSCCW
jgi:hypothetical protein